MGGWIRCPTTFFPTKQASYRKYPTQYIPERDMSCTAERWRLLADWGTCYASLDGTDLPDDCLVLDRTWEGKEETISPPQHGLAPLVIVNVGISDQADSLDVLHVNTVCCGMTRRGRCREV